MYQIDLGNPIHIHFIGIGGISMSGLAENLHTKNFTVSGSDAKRSKVTEHLENLGIQIYYGQRASNIMETVECVVYTAAVKADNLEFMAAVEKGLPMLDRAELLGQIMLYYKNSISIAGTHGKTTVTAMLSLILMEGGLDPTISIGGILDSIGGNIRIGSSDYFVVESCEYTNSFLKFHPKHEIILNIEADHLDYFKNLEDIRHSFRLFAEKIPEDGYLVINGEIDNYHEITNNLSCNIITYGMYKEDADLLEPPYIYDYAAANIAFNEWGLGSFDLIRHGVFIRRFSLAVAGSHNISNSLGAIALSDKLNINMDSIQAALHSFTGTKRRFEKKGVIGGIAIFDDYAHHPSEIEATLSAAKACPHKAIWCVFQPHTYTRTKALLHDFAKALSLADVVVLTDIYAAREKDPGDISSRHLLQELKTYEIKAYHFQSFDEIENFLLQHCENGDLIITMGAGDVNIIGESLLGKA